MKLRELYSTYLANWLSGGRLINKDKISLIGIRPLFDRILTHDYITKSWVITQLPLDYNVNLTDAVRRKMFELYPDVKTIINIHCVPVNVNIHSEVFKRQMKNASLRYEKVQGYYDALSESDKLTGVTERIGLSKSVSVNKEVVEAAKTIYESYSYVYAETTKGQKFCNTYYIIQASAKSKHRIQQYASALKDILSGEGLVYREIQGHMTQYLENFSPASYLHPDIAHPFVSMLMSQENVISLLPYRTKGLVSTDGTLFGKEMLAKLPFLLNMHNSGAAQVVMFAGKAGCGKTYAAFAVVLDLILRLGVHCLATDVKGNEWSKLSAFVDTLIIDMSGQSPRFVNTLRLDDMGCTIEDSMDSFDTAIRGTVNLFEIITNLHPNEGNPADLRDILNTAVSKLYSSRGVSGHLPETFSKTADMKYADVLNILADVAKTKSFNDNQRMLCDLVRTRASNYFLSEGRYAAAFKNEVSLAEIMQTPLVIFSLNKNAGESLDSMDNLRVFMAKFLSGKKQSIRKRSGLHTTSIYEELQRCEHIGTIVDAISQDVTGSRSNNVTIFLLLNSIKTLDNPAFDAIKSNITTKVIGKLEAPDIKLLVEDYGCADIEQYLNMISINKGEKYTNCFAVQYDTGLDTNSLMYKTVMPDSISAVFNTRDRLTA